MGIEFVSAWKRHASAFRQFLALAWREATEDKLIIRASGLAYTSLLALVPLMAVAFALLTAFDAFSEFEERVESLLLDRLLPAGQDEISRHIDTFVENAQNLSFVGFALLIVTAMMLLDTIEWNFNGIWRVGQRRKPMNRLMAYTSALVFGTLFIGLSLAASSRVETLLLAPDRLPTAGVLWTVGTKFFPLISSFLAFLLLFKFIPLTRVRLTSAAIGAASTAVAWEFAKQVFAVAVGGSVRYSAIYGSLASIPIFLIWLDVTWILVLVGLEIAYVHQNRRALTVGRHFDVSPRQRIALALDAMIVVSRRFHDGQAPTSEERLAERLDIPETMACDAAERLEDLELLRRVEGDDDHGFVPARSLDNISVADLLRQLWREPKTGHSDGFRASEEATVELIETVETAGLDAFGDRSLLEVVKP